MVCNHSSVLHILALQFRPRNVDFFPGIMDIISNKIGKICMILKWYKMRKNVYAVAKNVIKQVPVQRFGFIFGGEHIVNENAKKTRIFYIFIRLPIKVWAFPNWNGFLIVLLEYEEQLVTKTERTYEWNKLSSLK